MAVAWVVEQWNRPDRTDHYLMLIATSVQRVLAKHPNKIQLSHNKLTFGKQERKPASKEQAAAVAKAAWISRMTKPVVIKEKEA